MKNLLCEIKDDDSLVVIQSDITEEDALTTLEWSAENENKRFILIPHKKIKVQVSHFGHDIKANILD